MTSLARLLELVHRTQLPTVVQISDVSEPCVILPLGVYERLIGTAVLAAPVRLADPLDERSFSLEGMLSEASAPLVEEPRTALCLQDLLQPQREISTYSGLSAVLPQSESIEDRFAFEGIDVRILPRIKQKEPSSEATLDGSGQTLA